MKKEEIIVCTKSTQILPFIYDKLTEKQHKFSCSIHSGWIRRFQGSVKCARSGQPKKNRLDESYLDSLCAAIYVYMFVYDKSCRVQELQKNKKKKLPKHPLFVSHLSLISPT